MPRKKREEYHVDNLIFTGCSKYINEIFLPKIPDRFDASLSKVKRIDDEFNFLRRKYNSIQMEDKSEILNDQEKTILFRSIVGSGMYLCRERYDVPLTVKELASRMADPTTMSFHHLKMFLRYLKQTIV